MKKFGIVGTFSDDCSKPIAEGGARAIYAVPATRGYPTFTAINRFGMFQSQIERVDQVDANTLVMYVVHPGGAWDEIDMRKEGTGFRTTKMVVHKRNEWRPLVTIDAGSTVGSSGVDGAAGLLIEKCSD